MKVTAFYLMDQKEHELPDNATAADLLKFYNYRGIYMKVNDVFVLEDFDKYRLHDGDQVRLLRHLVAGG